MKGPVQAEHYRVGDLAAVLHNAYEELHRLDAYSRYVRPEGIPALQAADVATDPSVEEKEANADSLNHDVATFLSEMYPAAKARANVALDLLMRIWLRTNRGGGGNGPDY